MVNVGVAGAECKSAQQREELPTSSPERFVLHVCEKIAAWSWKLKTVRSNQERGPLYETCIVLLWLT